MATVTTMATTSTVTTVTASTSSGTTTTAFPSVPIYKPKFDWSASNLYEKFKLFKQKCTYLLINGPYSHVPANMQVSIFLNWLGDQSYELINTLNFPVGKSKDVLNDAIEQFESYFKPSQSTFQSWYELGSIYSSQFKNQNDFLNKLLDVSKDCELENPNELVKFLFLVHNQNGCVHKNLLKEMKSDSTLQDCLHIAKLTEGTVHVEKLGQNSLANVEKHDQNVDAVNHGRQQFKKQNGSKFRQQSHSHSKGGNKDNKGGKKCGNCGTNHPPRKCPACGKDGFQCKKKGHFSAYCRSGKNSQQHGHTPTRGPRHQHEVEQDDNGDDWTFSLNQDEVVIKFTDSVTKTQTKTLHLNPMKIVPQYLTVVIHYTNSGSN